MIIFFPSALILMLFFSLKWHFYNNPNMAETDIEQAKYRRRIWTLTLMMLSVFFVEIVDYYLQ